MLLTVTLRYICIFTNTEVYVTYTEVYITYTEVYVTYTEVYVTYTEVYVTYTKVYVTYTEVYVGFLLCLGSLYCSHFSSPSWLVRFSGPMFHVDVDMFCKIYFMYITT